MKRVALPKSLNEHISIRVDRDTMKLITRRAALEQIRPSVWMRQTLLSALQPEKETK